MIKIAVYGKGGIGKSTITSNLSAAFARLGKKVIQIGCDPKADSTINLLNGDPVIPVMNYLREYDKEPETLSEISKEGFGGILCIETGGPTPGLGCAGRGIITTFSLLEDLRLFETYQPDIVLYDVLGDVVCGGFAAPIRENYASHILIVTSGEKMALYAARNIHAAVQNFADRAYAKVFGLVMNRRNVENEEEKVAEALAAWRSDGKLLSDSLTPALVSRLRSKLQVKESGYYRIEIDCDTPAGVSVTATLPLSAGTSKFQYYDLLFD